MKPLRRAWPCRSLAATLFLLLAALVPGAAGAAAPAPEEAARWRAHGEATTIVRDEWGIAHVHGHTDADAVYGMIYAQAEDDFRRIETNFLVALGRLAEAEGEAAVFQDLRMRLFIEPRELQRRYAASPAWLRRLMTAWADGLNAFLQGHPDVHPRVLRRFEPWMALAFSEGSIGGDIERVALGPLQAFYGPPGGAPPLAAAPFPPEPRGSNGIAIAPARSASGHALLLINPHTSFFFRSELQMSSDEGLDAYGAVTWGQFFVYQGFNGHAGWMHTSSGVDNVDFFLETIVRQGGALSYRYGKELRPVSVRRVALDVRGAGGRLARRSFTVYATHHGPVVREEGGRWVSVALMQKPVEALSQSFLRTKARDLRGFLEASQLRANSSNNTVFADAGGQIAYLHPQFVPRRDDRFDYTRPVDGADPATDWQGLHELGELPRVVDPPSGWIANTNNWPYSAAGPDSPRRADFPAYMDTAGENARGRHALKLLAGGRSFTPDTLRDLAFDSYLTGFERALPALLQDYDALPAQDARRAALGEPVALLRAWDLRWSAPSAATTLAVLWGDRMWDELKDAAQARRAAALEQKAPPATVPDEIADHADGERRLAALASVCDRLRQDYGDWRVPWERVNRFEHLPAEMGERFSDAAPSVGIAFASGRWGSLASFGAHRYPGTRAYYGTSGNSFVAIVEFDERVKARAVSIGGESGDPASAHFNDQVARYAAGALRPVYFYPDELEGHVERRYHPL